MTRPTEMTKATASGPAVLLLGILLRTCQVTHITRDFTAAFFMVAMGGKEPKCQATEDWLWDLACPMRWNPSSTKKGENDALMGCSPGGTLNARVLKG